MFSGKVVLITGASSGIGAAAAVRFAAEGAEVALTGRNKENLQETAKKCRQKSKFETLLIPGDLTVDSDVKNIIDSTIKTYGKLDVLVNNAAWMTFSALGGPDTVEKFDKIFNTNVRSVYLLTNLAVPHLIKSKGNIVNISSVAGLRTFRNGSAYGMSKAALDHFTRCAALELGPKKVRVNGINPGSVETNLRKNAGLDDKTMKHLSETAIKAYPIGRIGNVDDISSAILFLASEQAGFITGESLVVDGGLNIVSPMQL
ncbi:hypothetical protein Trydic_g23347 [Trypoxylus dichotomus]